MGGGGSKPSPTATDTLTTTMTTRVPVPIAGQMPLTAKILSMASPSLHTQAPKSKTNASSSLPTQRSSQQPTVPRPPAHVSWSSPSLSQLRRALTSSTEQATGKLIKADHDPRPHIAYSHADHHLRNILGHLDCSISHPPSPSPQIAACAWTIGHYPSSELANLTNSWITTSADSSATILPTITDKSGRNAQAFVNVAYTRDVYVTKWSDDAVRVCGLARTWKVVATWMVMVVVIVM